MGVSRILSILRIRILRRVQDNRVVARVGARVVACRVWRSRGAVFGPSIVYAFHDALTGIVVVVVVVVTVIVVTANIELCGDSFLSRGRTLVSLVRLRMSST